MRNFISFNKRINYELQQPSLLTLYRCTVAYAYTPYEYAYSLYVYAYAHALYVYTYALYVHAYALYA